MQALGFLLFIAGASLYSIPRLIHPGRVVMVVAIFLAVVASRKTASGTLQQMAGVGVIAAVAVFSLTRSLELSLGILLYMGAPLVFHLSSLCSHSRSADT